MNTQRLLTPSSDPSAWEQTLYAFLAEKHRRSGSERTVQGYSRMLRHCFTRIAKTPDQITGPDVLGWAHCVGLSGRQPAAVTIAARTACLSSFYKFCIRMGLLASNPCDALERPRIQPSMARGYTAEQVRILLAVIPDDVPGRRDRAIVLTLVLTGRRRSEVLNLKAGDITVEGDRAYYAYRGKGGKQGRRELPRPAYEAIVRSLADIGGSGVHILRYRAARLRREAGESVEAVSSFLDHSSLAVTTVYLRRLEGTDDSGWSAVAAVAEAIGA